MAFPSVPVRDTQAPAGAVRVDRDGLVNEAGVHRPAALVSLSSYGQEQALRRGQAALAAIAAEAGADGVEYRGELHCGGAAESAEQRAVAEQHHLQVVWSSPEGLWVTVPLAASAAPWRAILHALPADVPRAIEYPLQGDDLLAVTREQLAVARRTETLQ